MIIYYFVKFTNNRNVDRFQASEFETFWHDLREFMLRNNTGPLEWIIRE